MAKVPIKHIKTVIPEPLLSELFTIRDIGHLLVGRNLVQELHRHDFYFLLALQKGRGTHTIDFSPYTVSDRTIFFMRPGQVHQLVLEEGSQGFLIQFNDGFYASAGKLAGQLLRRVSSRNHYSLTASRYQRIQSILSYICQEYTERGDLYQEIILANLGLFFLELARECRNCPGGGTDLYMQEQWVTFTDLVEANLTRHKQVSEYAAMMHLSVYQLNAVTRTILGKTASEVIHDHLILEAKRYLLATSNQVGQIAWQLGYEDVSYFSRFFKNHN